MSGTLGSLTNVATAVTFSAALTYQQGTAVPTIVSPNYIPLTLEPGTVNIETVWLTAYTSGATTGTITRGQEGAGVAHSNGAPFVCSATAIDMLPAAGVFNVKEYGAKGDGVTDDTVAIQAALTALNLSGGSDGTQGKAGTVYIPPGIYICNSLNFYSSTIFRGAGRGSTVFSLTGANGLAWWTFTGQQDLEMCDFTVDGTNGTGNGIGLTNGLRVAIRRVRIHDTNGQGILYYACADSVIEDCDVENCGRRNAGTNTGPQSGIVLNTGTTSSRIRIVNNRVSNANDSGIMLNQAGSTGAVDCVVSGNTVIGSFYIGIAAGSNGTKNTITGNTVVNSTNHGVDIGNSTYTSVTNNIIDGCLSGFSNDMSTAPAGTYGGNIWTGNTVSNATNSGMELGSVNGTVGDIVIGNTFETPALHGMVMGNYSRCVIKGNVFHNAPDGIDLNQTSTNNLIEGNIFHDDRGGSSVMVAIDYVAYTGGNNTIINNDMSLVHAFISGTPAATDVYRNNIGYNPVTKSAPAFPATTVLYTNTTNVDIHAFITNGAAAMTTQVNGNTGPSLAISGTATIFLAAGVGTFKATYASGSPTWVFQGN